MKIIPFSRRLSYGYFVVGKKTIVVDTGLIDSPDAFLSLCSVNYILPSSISLIFITHEHPDHFGGVEHIKAVCSAPIICHSLATQGLAGDYPHMIPLRRPTADKTTWSLATYDLPNYFPEMTFDAYFPLNEFGIEGHLLHTPGHSPGSSSLILDDRRALIGDMLIPGNEGMELAMLAQDCKQLELSYYKLLCSADLFYSGHSTEPITREQLEELLKAESML